MIGTGKFSIVYKCIERSTEKQYALKVVELEKLTENARQAIRYIKNNTEMKVKSYKF